ncbi:DNA gyrase subunit A [Kiritimatiella glycovorans]|uniref:DNA gyrase subunit A n=1 Tax=Kiritimatiella glycovorans TaxID=1307763 RepID=A0A0G3EIK4_9BACT|nr:DNA gyrase subunit A [Kiritimatiella glycovorans]AKJ64645.1 DNA gyrase subunit A [Kiritimatiella glycovorans]
MIEPGQERIDRVNLEEEMQRAYIDYSMSVIVGRALPDARDGLKPGHRRILYAMRERGWSSSKPYVKCAKVVGETIGNYHPHGDMAVYDTLVRMAQDFSMRCGLIDGQGNFGSIDGDNAAAYRYTECRLTAAAEELLADIDKETVDTRPNFDETTTEPVVLPARLPNLLLNGSTGIAVGMATNIPPHNLGEIVDGIIHLIDRPDTPCTELLQFVKGPDFPTAGIVRGAAGIRSFYETGRGRMKMRGRAEIEEDDKGRARIIITEIPYAVNKAALITKAAQLVRDKKLEGISDIRDESDKRGIRVVVEIKRGAVPKVVLNNLYRHTTLESTFGAIMLALDHGRPRVMNLKEVLQCFVDHRLEVLTRRTRYELEKAEARAHIVEGLLKALDHLDEVVRTIRESRNRDEAESKLIARFEFSEAQAKAILEMRLYQLTGLEREKLEEEYGELQERIAYLRSLLESRRKMLEVLKGDLVEMKERYAGPRLTELQPGEDDMDMEDLIADAPCVVTLSRADYIKRVPVDTYRQQRRGGKGVRGMATKDEDAVKHVMTAMLHDTMLCFTETGRLYRLKTWQIPEAARQSRGRSVANLLQLEEEESLASIHCVREFTDDCCLLMATRKGIVKKTPLSAYRNIRTVGIRAVNVEDGDRLVGVRLVREGDDVLLTTRRGMTIRFSEAQARPMGRVARGVRGISLSSGDEVVSLEIVDPETDLLTVTEQGYGKRTSFDEYRRQSRGGKGLIGIRLTERNGNVVGAHAVREEDGVMLITQSGQLVCIAVNEVSRIGRNTQGVRLVRLNEDDRLVSAAVLLQDATEGEDEADAEQQSAEPEETEPPREEGE